MRVLILADRPFAAHERDMLTRVQVGLIDEGARVIEALPTDVADPDANPLIPTIAYSDQTAILASRARTRRILRGLQAIDPPLAPPDNPAMLVDVIHVFGAAAWPVAVSVASVTGASVAAECSRDADIRHMRALEKTASTGDLTATGVWIAANAQLGKTIESVNPAWPVVVAAWGTHTQDRPPRVPRSTTPMSISMIATGDEPASINGLLVALSTCPHLPEDAMIFADATAFERHPALWRRARDLGLLARMSLIDRMEARRDLVLQTDILVVPEATGQTRSIILDAMASEMAILARADPQVEATSAPGVAVLAPAGTVDAWSDALTRLLANADHRARMGRAARAFVVANRPVYKQIEAILGAYALVRHEPVLKFPEQ